MEFAGMETSIWRRAVTAAVATIDTSNTAPAIVPAAKLAVVGCCVGPAERLALGPAVGAFVGAFVGQAAAFQCTRLLEPAATA